MLAGVFPRTELLERYQRSERALVAALAEMYVQGVSTCKVKAITEELCDHSFSASSISAMNQRLDPSPFSAAYRLGQESARVDPGDQSPAATRITLRPH